MAQCLCGFSLFIVFSVAELSERSETITICQIPLVYTPYNLEHIILWIAASGPPTPNMTSQGNGWRVNVGLWSCDWIPVCTAIYMHACETIRYSPTLAELNVNTTYLCQRDVNWIRKQQSARCRHRETEANTKQLLQLKGELLVLAKRKVA